MSLQIHRWGKALSSFSLCVIGSPGVSQESRQREPFPKKSPPGRSSRAWRDLLGPRSSLSAPPPAPRPTPHAPNHFVAAAHTFVPLGHSRGCAPSLAPLGTCHPLLLVARVLPPLPPLFTGAPEHLRHWGPESELALRRALSPLPLGKPREVTPRCASLAARPLAASLRAVEAAPDRHSPRSGRRNWAGRTPRVTPGAARLAKRRPPPAPHQALSGGGSCSHPAPGSGYSPPPSASRARRRKSDSSLQPVLSRCAKLGVWKRTETRLPSRPSKPEPRLRSISLLGTLLGTELRLLEQIPFLRGRCVKTPGKCCAVNLRLSGKSWANSLLAAAGPWPDGGQIFLSQGAP